MNIYKIGLKVRVLRSCTLNRCMHALKNKCPFIGDIGKVVSINKRDNYICVDSFQNNGFAYPGGCSGFQAENLELVPTISRFARFMEKIEKK